jgi:hypothetical protein
MVVANTLAFYNMATITSVKSFMVQVPGVQGFSISKEANFIQSACTTKLFTVVIFAVLL